MIEILKDFENYLLEDGKRAKTIESYVRDVKELLNYLKDKGVIFDGTLSRFYIISYKTYLLDKEYERTTINKRINSFYFFNYYLIKIKKNS